MYRVFAENIFHQLKYINQKRETDLFPKHNIKDDILKLPSNNLKLLITIHGTILSCRPETYSRLCRSFFQTEHISTFNSTAYGQAAHKTFISLY